MPRRYSPRLPIVWASALSVPSPCAPIRHPWLTLSWGPPPRAKPRWRGGRRCRQPRLAATCPSPLRPQT
eukprot:3300924-Prymnesium_polylepis.1